MEMKLMTHMCSPVIFALMAEKADTINWIGQLKQRSFRKIDPWETDWFSFLGRRRNLSWGASNLRSSLYGSFQTPPHTSKPCGPRESQQAENVVLVNKESFFPPDPSSFKTWTSHQVIGLFLSSEPQLETCVPVAGHHVKKQKQKKKEKKREKVKFR